MEPVKCHVENPWAKQNGFLTMPPESAPLPVFGQSQPLLPQPHWDARPDVIRAYWKAWELGFSHLRAPTSANGFVSNYIDTAFNDHLFMWDSSFILCFGKYGRRVFTFQHTLDNLYAKQHPDGFICREIDEASGDDCFERYDPASTGPNILAWTEWEYYLNVGDRERLSRVFPVLVAYHQWLRTYRTWKDGTYWSSGWGCGMDNQPRSPEPGFHDWFSHGHLTWADTTLQQLLSARRIVAMAEVLGRSAEIPDFASEIDRLTTRINSLLWDPDTAFYYDADRDGKRLAVKSIGAYWALLAECVDQGDLPALVAHLENPAEFYTPHPVASLSKDHPAYDKLGGYWLGAVWAPTNYMVLAGLALNGYAGLAQHLARRHLDAVVAVYTDTGTLWENYAPEGQLPGTPAKPDFVGWTGLVPIAVLFEQVFGLQPKAHEQRIVWHCHLTDAFGVSQYPFGKDGLLDLSVKPRHSPADRPHITVSSNVAVSFELHWDGQVETWAVLPGTAQF